MPVGFFIGFANAADNRTIDDESELCKLFGGFLCSAPPDV